MFKARTRTIFNSLYELKAEYINNQLAHFIRSTVYHTLATIVFINIVLPFIISILSKGVGWLRVLMTKATKAMTTMASKIPRTISAISQPARPESVVVGAKMILVIERRN